MTDSESTPTQMDIGAILETLPHRYPFLLIDRVLEIDFENLRVVAIKNVTINEPQFMGHYPGLPIMPGVLLIEAMAQAAAVFLLSQPKNKGKVPFFTGLNSVKFRRQVVPGDQLRIEVQVTHQGGRMTKATARTLVDGKVVVEAQLNCMSVAAPQ